MTTIGSGGATFDVWRCDLSEIISRYNRALASGTLPSTTMAFAFSGSRTPTWYPNTVESLRKKGVRAQH